MQPVPIPTDEQIKAATPTPDPRLDPSTHAQMPPVYYGGKAGGAAFIADKVLTGWLAGTKIANERKHQQMVDEVSSAKTGLDYIGQAYRAAVESGDQQRIKETSGALSEAWNDYLNKAEKYSLPDAKIDQKTGKPKKEGVGQRFKEAFSGGPAPNLGIAHSTLGMLRKTDPREMYGPSKAEQQQAKLTDLQVSGAERQEREAKGKDEAMARYQRYGAKPDSQLTPEERKDREFIDSYYFGKSKEQLIRDNLLGKITDGAKLNDNERQLAESYGWIKPNVVNTVVNQTVDAKGRPINELVSIGPDGKIVGRQMLGRGYVGPDQADIATKMINGQVQALTKLAKKAHPEWDEQTLYKYALSQVGRGAAGTEDWLTQQQAADTFNRAAVNVLKKHQRMVKDPQGHETQTYDQIGAFATHALLAQDDEGLYHYGSTLGIKPQQETTGWLWWKKNAPPTIGGLNEKDAQSLENQFLAEVRAEIKAQNKKASDADIDKLMPKALLAQGIPNPPGQQPQAAQNRAMPGAPEQNQPGEQTYVVKLPNGQTVQKRMSKEQADYLKSQGINVEQSGMITNIGMAVP